MDPEKESCGISFASKKKNRYRDEIKLSFVVKLSANRKFSAIFSAWDPGALAAKQAAKALGILDKIFIVGFDGNDANYRAIKEGEITATVRQQPFLMGTEGVDIITKIFNGETDYPAEKLIPGQVIDKTNVDTVFSE